MYLYYFSELWRKETTLTQNLSSLKEDLAKADQALRSMAGKVRIFLNLARFYNKLYKHFDTFSQHRNIVIFLCGFFPSSRYIIINIVQNSVKDIISRQF